MLKAYKAAEHLIGALKDAESGWTAAKCAPRLFGTMLTSSAALIARFVHSDKSELIDLAAGKENFHTALSLHDSMSIESNDYSFRAPGMLRALWDVYAKNPLETKKLELKVQTRRGASLLHDFMQEWREHFGQNSLEDLFRRPPRIPPSLVLQKSSRQTPGKIWTDSQDRRDLADPSDVTDRMNTQLSKTGSMLLPEEYGETQNTLEDLPDQGTGAVSIDGLPPPWDDLPPDVSFISYPDWTWDSGMFADGQL